MSLLNHELNQMIGIHLKAYVVKNLISIISSILFHSKIFYSYNKIKYFIRNFEALIGQRFSFKNFYLYFAIKYTRSKNEIITG